MHQFINQLINQSNERTFNQSIETTQQVLRYRSVHVLVVFGNEGGGLMFMSFYTIM